MMAGKRPDDRHPFQLMERTGRCKKQKGKLFSVDSSRSPGLVSSLTIAARSGTYSGKMEKPCSSCKKCFLELRWGCGRAAKGPFWEVIIGKSQFC
jgi:hypothetical protein